MEPARPAYVAQETGKIVSVAPGGKPRVEAGGFATPLGLTWFRGALYVSTQGTLWRISGGHEAGDRAAPAVRPAPAGQRRARARRAALPRQRLDLRCVPQKSRLSAAILSVRPDGSDLRVVASGLRNPFGLAFDGSRLYVSVNNRDKVPAPAETLVRIRQGAFYGWPRCWASETKRAMVGSCAGVTKPVAYLEQHSSADGLVVYRGRSFGRRVPRQRLHRAVG